MVIFCNSNTTTVGHYYFNDKFYYFYTSNTGVSLAFSVSKARKRQFFFQIILPRRVLFVGKWREIEGRPRAVRGEFC